MKILIKGKFILPITSPPIEDGFVTISGETIEKIGGIQELTHREDEFDIIVDGNLIVMPGFVNTHTHVAMVGFRGIRDDLPLMKWLNEYIWPLERELVTPEFIRVFLELGIMEMIESGTTCFADMYFFQMEAAKIVDKIGIRAFLAEGIIDYPTPNKPNPESQIEYTENFIKEFKDHPLITPCLGPHAPYSTSPWVFKRCREISDKYSVPILTHIAETTDEIEFIREKFGKTPVEHLRDISLLCERVVSAHSIYLTKEDMNIFRDYKVGVAHCPESNMKLASGCAPIPEYIQLGIKVGLATDGASSNNDLDMIGEMRTCALVHKLVKKDPTVIDAQTVVKMATLGGAEVLGISHMVGSLEPGKAADIITIEIGKTHLSPIFNPYSHIVYSSKSSDVRDVFVKGKPLMLDHNLLTLDKEKILHESEKYQLKIKKFLNL